MTDIVVLPPTWDFPIGAQLVPQGEGTVEYTVIARASDVSGVACYRVKGFIGEPAEPVDGWLPKVALEGSLKQVGETTVTEL